MHRRRLAAPLAVTLVVLLRVSSAAAQDAGPQPSVAAEVAAMDAGPGPDAGPTLPGPGGIGTSPERDAVDAIYRGVVDGNAFLAVGALLSLLVIGARWGLAKKWPTFSSDPGGVVVVIGLAVAGGLANAWMASGVDSHTFVGIVKVIAAAVATYVVPKKLLFGDPTPKPAPPRGVISGTL